MVNTMVPTQPSLGGSYTSYICYACVAARYMTKVLSIPTLDVILCVESISGVYFGHMPVPALIWDSYELERYPLR